MLNDRIVLSNIASNTPCNENLLSIDPFTSIDCERTNNNIVLSITGLPSNFVVIPSGTTINLNISQVKYPTKMLGYSFILILKNPDGSVIAAENVTENSWGPSLAAQFTQISATYRNANVEVYRYTDLVINLTPFLKIIQGIIVIQVPSCIYIDPTASSTVGQYSFDDTTNTIYLSSVTIKAGTPKTIVISSIYTLLHARETVELTVKTYEQTEEIAESMLVHSQNVQVGAVNPGIINISYKNSFNKCDDLQ